MSDTHKLLIHASYLLATALFVIGLRRLSRVKTARGGNFISSIGMLLAIIATLSATTSIGWYWILGGIVIGGAIGAMLAYRVEMTSMPELVAFFNGMGGGASAAVALSFFFDLPISDIPGHSFGALVPWHVVLVTCLSVIIGTLTLSGSLIAFGKLSGKLSGKAILLPGRHAINIAIAIATIAAGVIAAYFAKDVTASASWFVAIAVLAFALGIMLVIPIGGADMPVVISLLNSYSGIAASMAGFVLLGKGEPSAYMLIIAGALVGASGLILTNLMCKAMNRSLTNVLLGGFGETAGATDGKSARDYKNVKSFSADEAAMILDGADMVIVVPGYGLAVAQAQHALAELESLLESRGTTVKYAIHPVAGRMPGHMNVLLAEANIDYEKLYDLEINSEFRMAQVAIVVGANDVVNPAATNDPASPIAGMPILNAHEAQNVIMIKRSLSPGYAGIKNELFEYDNTMMLFSDAKKALLDVARAIKEL